ncbi:menaquinone-dependent protoporphyrinogen IX dehydrogenase [Alteromonadales bacterium alter-6D02]|nr:menaquinone-dependent protoporphyrinogen IX dehydrogenase [Alteromonadales bacterium alter-6D02]
MSFTLLIYSTSDGQTLKICQAIADKMQQEQQAVKLLSLDDADNVDWQEVDKLIIGASIRYGHFNKQVMAFVKQHQEQIEQRPNGFFCVNLTARKPNKNTPETNAYMKKFIKLSPWQPQLQAVFAGALLYSKYRWSDKLIIRLIMKITGGVTDTSQDIEYTDWNKVEQYAQEIIALS